MAADNLGTRGKTKLSEPVLNKESYRRLIEAANEGIWLLDLDLKIFFVNTKAIEILGYTRDEIMGKTPLDFLVEGQKASVMEMIKELQKGKTITHENRLLHKNGSIIWVWVSSSPVFDSSGRHIANLGMFTDITKRKKYEQALRESEEKYHHLVENASEGIIVVQDGRIKFINRKMIELTEYSEAELGIGPFTRFIYPDDQALVQERYQRRLDGETPPAFYEFRLWTKSGEIKWVKISAVLINWDGRPATLNFITDINEYKNNQEKIQQKELQLQKERAFFTKKLIAVQEEERKRIARELHDDAASNLSLIILEIDQLLNSGETLSEKALFQLHRLREETDRTQKEIRRYSHELRPGVLDYLGLEAALESLGEDMKSRDEIKVNLEIEGQQQRLPGDVELALFRIAQEAMNNIHKHSEATQATISLDYAPEMIRLNIKDNGKGFDTSAIKIPEISGGMGLIGMRERAQLIGASLNIISSPGQGTIVSVEIPVEKTVDGNVR